MNRDAIYIATLQMLGETLRDLEGTVPAPHFIEVEPGWPNWRYLEKLPEQAILLKLARLATGLHSARVLLFAGLLQDLGATKRVVDEMTEDVSFLSAGIRAEAFTEYHDRFLEEFWQEEFDNPDPKALTSRARDRVPREKVRAYLARSAENVLDQSTSVRVNRTLSRTFSGYVHGASVHILEMYGGTAGFAVSGMRGTRPWQAQAEDTDNYFLRAICAFGIGAHAMGKQDLLPGILDFRRRFEEALEMTFPAHKAKPTKPASR